MIDTNWSIEFQHAILAAALRGDLLRQVPLDPELFRSRDKGPKSPIQAVAEILVTFYTAYQKPPTLIEFRQLVDEAAKVAGPERREALADTVALILTAELPDPANIRDRVKQQLELRAFEQAMLQTAPMLSNPEQLEAAREIMTTAMQPIGTTATLLTLASTITPKTVPWVWPGYIPRGMPVLIVGEPATNKSTMLIDYAARMTTGKAFPGQPSTTLFEPEPVVYLSAEDSPEYTILPRFLAAGGDPSRFYVLAARVDGPGFTLEQDVPRLDAAIRETGARHLLVDPLNAFLPTTDTWKDNAIRSALRPLVTLAEKRDLGQLSIVHLNKKSEQNGLQRIMGSVGYAGMARAVYLVAVDPDVPTRRFFVCLKASVMAKPAALAFTLQPTSVRTDGGATLATLAIEWDTSTPVEISAEDLLRPPRKRTTEQTGADRIRDLLAAGPVLATALEETLAAEGIAGSTYDRAVVKASVSFQTTRKGKRKGAWYRAPIGWTRPQFEAWWVEQEQAE